MKKFYVYLIHCVLILLMLSGCAASIAKRLELDLPLTSNDEKPPYELSQKELFVLYKVENGQITIKDVKKYGPSEKQLNNIYLANQSNLNKLDSGAVFCDCVRISKKGYGTCSDDYAPEGGLYSQKKVNAGGVFSTVLFSPIWALGLVLDTRNTIDSLSSLLIDKANDHEQIRLLGTHLNNLLLKELKAATRDYDSIKRLLDKYPDAGFGSSPYILKKLSKFAADDYARLDKTQISAINNFIDKYSEIGQSRCFTPTISKLNVRKGPGTKDAIAFTIGRNDTICSVLENRNGWVKFSGSEIKSRYSGEYWVSEKYLKKTPAKAVAGNKLPSLLAQAKKIKLNIQEKRRLQRKRQLAAKEARRKKALAKKRAAARKQKIARVQKQLDAALASNSMLELETFITAHKNDSEVASLIKVANVKYKELLFK